MYVEYCKALEMKSFLHFMETRMNLEETVLNEIRYLLNNTYCVNLLKEISKIVRFTEPESNIGC